MRRREVGGAQVVGIGVGYAVAFEKLEPLRAHERRADLRVQPVVAQLDVLRRDHWAYWPITMGRFAVRGGRMFTPPTAHAPMNMRHWSIVGMRKT